MKVLVSQKVEAIAGSEKYLLYLLPALQERGIEVEFLTLYPTGEKHKIADFESQLKTRNISVFNTPVNHFPSLSQLKTINRIIKRGNYDIVHVNLLAADFIFALIKILFNRKMVLVSGKHGYEPAYTNQFGFDPSKRRHDLYWYCAVFAEKFINRSYAISKGLFDLHLGLGISKKDRLELIHYGFDFADDCTVDTKHRYGYPQLAIVGRLTAFKGHRYAIEALKILKNRYPEIKLVIVGWGELEQDLITMVQTLGLQENVIFTGFYPKPREIMFNSDIVLLPSISEGFGIVVLEAMSVKRPVVAFNVPSPSEIFQHCETGMLATPYSVDEYASLIEQLIENESERHRLADNAYQKLKEYYNLSRMINQTVDFYKAAVKTSSKKHALQTAS